MAVTRLFTDDPTVASRYLADQLSEDERQTFEAQLLVDPKVLRELEATARFKLGLQKLRDAGRLDDLIAGRRPGMAWLLSAVAAVAVLVIGIGVLRWSTESGPMLAAELSALVDGNGNPLHLGATYSVFRKRAAGYDAVVDLPASQEAIALRVLPDAELPLAKYVLSLWSVSAGARSEVARLPQGVEPAADGSISLFVDSARLTPGDYQLVLTDAEAAASPRQDTFTIQVRPPPNR